MRIEQPDGNTLYICGGRDFCSHHTMASKAVEKKNEALKLIDELFGDTSVANTTTLDLLQELQSEVDSKIDALKCDIKNKKE